MVSKGVNRSRVSRSDVNRSGVKRTGVNLWLNVSEFQKPGPEHAVQFSGLIHGKLIAPAPCSRIVNVVVVKLGVRINAVFSNMQNLISRTVLQRLANFEAALDVGFTIDPPKRCIGGSDPQVIGDAANLPERIAHHVFVTNEINARQPLVMIQKFKALENPADNGFEIPSQERQIRSHAIARVAICADRPKLAFSQPLQCQWRNSMGFDQCWFGNTITGFSQKLIQLVVIHEHAGRGLLALSTELNQQLSADVKRPSRTGSDSPVTNKNGRCH